MCWMETYLAPKKAVVSWGWPGGIGVIIICYNPPFHLEDHSSL